MTTSNPLPLSTALGVFYLFLLLGRLFVFKFVIPELVDCWFSGAFECWGLALKKIFFSSLISFRLELE